VKRWVTAGLCSIAWLGAAWPAAAAPAMLTRADEGAFPNRSFVLALPTAQSIDPQRVRVLENGHRVAALSVLSASQAGGRQLAVVLVVDTSRSMTGRPIRDALSAARAFASHRNAQQQLGVVTFNGAAHVLLPLTSDAAAIRRALVAPPPLGRNTHIYDAVSTAVGLLERGHISGGSVLVLSDGTDTGSRLGLDAVAAQAGAAGVRVYTVGLHSGAFDATALSDLAARAGGAYSQAGSSSALARIYDQLGAQLSSQYIIRYRSLALPHTRVTVSVNIGGTPYRLTSSYATPALPAHPAPPYHRAFWQSSSALLFAALASGVLLACSVMMLLRAQPRRRSVRSRLAEFVTSPQKDAAARGAPRRSRLFGETSKKLERKQWWANFQEELDVARIDVPATRIVALTAIVTCFAIWLLAVVTGSGLVALLGFGLPLGVYAAIRRKLEHQRRLFAEQLADNLQVIASAMRAGQSFVGALATALSEAPEPVSTEFRRISEDERIGVPLEEAMSVVARRMQNRDMDQVQLVATLARQTGGNSADVLDQVADTIRQRMDLRRSVRTLTAQGRLSRWVLTAVPVALIILISTVNKGYLQPLLHTGTGQVLLVFALLMVAAGSYVVKKIVEIEV
jgi:tight adherence protein B